MAPVNQLGVLAFASAVLAVPHVQPFHKRHAHASAPAYESDYVPAYGGSSSSYADPASSGPPAYGSSSSYASPISSSVPAYPAGSSSSWAAPLSSSVIVYPSGSSSSAPVPSASGFPECWATCFSKNGNPSEDELCGNEEVSKCICDTCSPAEDKAYKGWLSDYCVAPSSSSYASPVSSSVIYYGSSSSAAPIPSGSGFPECWGTCFAENGNPSEAELCGNDDVSACIHETCSPAEDKAYWDWYNSYCSAASSSSYAAPVSSAPYYPIPSGSSSGWAKPTGGYGSGFPSYSTCTETSTLIYRSTTAYSTYYVTHTIYKSEAAASSAAPVSEAPGYPAGSAPAYNAVPASSAAPVSEAPGYGAPSGAPSGPAGPAGGESCVPDATVTTTVKTTVYVTPEGPYGGAPTSEAAPSYPASSEAWPVPSGGAPSYPAAPSSAAPASSGWAAPSYPAGSSAAPSAPSSAPTYSGDGGLIGKRGIAYNDANLANSLGGGAAGGWAYNWLSDASGLDSSIPYIPMLHSPTDDFTGTWSENAKKGIAAGVGYLFSFNEPDMSTQSNLSPEAAAAAWKQYMEPFAGQAKLVAPSVTNGQDANMGLNWLQSFFDACSDCTIDAVAQHWYFPTNDVENFKDQITKAAAMGGGKGVFLNEFGATGSDEEKSAFLSEILPWLDSNPDVLGYSYFMVADGSLMNGDAPSTYGETYCS